MSANSEPLWSIVSKLLLTHVNLACMIKTCMNDHSDPNKTYLFKRTSQVRVGLLLQFCTTKKKLWNKILNLFFPDIAAIVLNIFWELNLTSWLFNYVHNIRSLLTLGNRKHEFILTWQEIFFQDFLATGRHNIALDEFSNRFEFYLLRGDFSIAN